MQADFLQMLASQEIDEFLGAIKNNQKQCLFGLQTSEKAILFAIAGGGIYVANDLVSAERISAQLEAIGISNKLLSSSFTNLLGLKDNSVYYDFISSLYDFLLGKTKALVVLPEILFEKLPEESELLKNLILFEKSKDYSFDKTIERLVELGYTRVELPSRKGQFSVRGDILDVFDISSSYITRLEFFGDTLDKISRVNSEDFSLIEELDEVELYPAVLLKIKELNLISLDANIFFDEPKKLSGLADTFIKTIENKELFLPISKVFSSEAKSQVAFSNIVSQTSFFRPDKVITFKCGSSKKYLFNFKELVEDIFMYKAGGYKIFLFCGDERNKKRIDEFLASNMLQTVELSHIDAGVRTIPEYLPYSASFLSLDAIIIGTLDLFKKSILPARKKDKVFYTPKVGDYVVHETHGVGKCIALERMKLADIEKDYFVIEYSGGDKLYLPSEQAGLISAFLGSDNAPKLNKLGGAEFERIKEKVYKNVKELAINLLALYSQREKAKGYKFTEGGYLYEMFESAFEHTETDDQNNAIADVLSDMESGKIMDRLICGDVGYGKTEVALRAIYKAVLNGKQVAFLCPTTILSEQHYMTCLKRFEGFMVRTAKLNRLTQPQVVNDVKKKLKSGEIDVVVGTHKLLGADVGFKDLGLLVLDEEQRFGVGDKEKIKDLKKDVDVLTLSATPIPRTLHMSLSGIRDISIIETPPKERIPIQTFVVEYSDELVIDACKKELSRGGQIFIIYNRVETIYQFAEKIRSLLPEAKIGVAHGQLSQKVLEDTILKLYEGDYQILIATTLIENGVDLPLANTIIVVDADRLGLSQLYQLRGRIGRGNRLAYAYFTFNGNKVLTEQAYKRLDAIMEFTDLGSGFKIAMRDLEIRGAGNVLGKEQHGHMEKVGYDMYCKLLTEAVKELKGEKVKERKEIKVEIALSAYIPDTYIESENERIKKYGEISEISSIDDLEKLKTELVAGYKEVPKVTLNLMYIALLKNLASSQNVKKIVVSTTACRLQLYKSEKIMSDKLAEVVEENKSIAVLKFEDLPIIEFKFDMPVFEKVLKLIELLN